MSSTSLGMHGSSLLDKEHVGAPWQRGSLYKLPMTETQSNLFPSSRTQLPYAPSLFSQSWNRSCEIWNVSYPFPSSLELWNIENLFPRGWERFPCNQGNIKYVMIYRTLYNTYYNSSQTLRHVGTWDKMGY